MPNQYFQFKQFTIDQDQCAMKVCTDSCLFGAWVADYLDQEKNNRQYILDIGTGTGLLALLIAQKTNAHIDAVETEEAASIQASNNFAASPWSKKLQTYNSSFQLFKTTIPNSYDFIISNPPFFENNLKSNNQLKNLALHSNELTLSDLILQIQFHLKLNGQFAILLPFDRSTYFIDKAQKAGFYIQSIINVKQTPKHPFFRSMMLFGYNSSPTITKEIIIKENNEYTTEFRDLLSAYYLPF